MSLSISPQHRLEDWFGSPYYHSLYQHRDNDEAFKFINHLLSELQPPPGSKILDLGCGSGRHSIHLAHYGFDVTGIDISMKNILKAQQSSSLNMHFIQGDMRQAFGDESYDYLFSFFTSFGYFNAYENSIVARNMARALKQGGTLLIDYFNSHFVRKNLVPFEVIEKDGIKFFVKRWIDGAFVHKQISVSDLEDKKEVLFTERVRLFQLKDLVKLFWMQGLALVNAYGDYELNEYHSGRSKRLILIFKK